MTRYAIYFVPAADTALWRFGCASIGYDSATGEDKAFHDHAFYRQDAIVGWTEAPRRYGFHATLKPPFELAAGTGIDELEAVAEAFAAERRAFCVDRFAVRAIGGFLALVPENVSEPINQLASDSVRAFERFRAPLSEADRARRLKSGLSASQIAHVDQWGYPYVFEEFRFHMTLTGHLPEAVRDSGLVALRELYQPISGAVRFDAVAICEQVDRDARFRVRRRLNFAG